MENIKDFNKEMIALGLMREATEEEKDRFEVLGKELTSEENKCYLAICNNGTFPINVINIALIMFPESEVIEKDIHIVDTLICRVRRKLGKNEIITIPNMGYVSRRETINSIVEINLQKANKK